MHGQVTYRCDIPHRFLKLSVVASILAVLLLAAPDFDPKNRQRGGVWVELIV